MDKRNVLLVEDNEDDAALTLRAFSKSNVMNKIITVADGQEALDYIFCKGQYEGRNPLDFPAVIFLDLNLPKVNGLEVLKTIRANEKTKLLPVVILTSSKEEQDILNGYSLGANSYIRKPVDSGNFFEAINALGMYWLLLNEPPNILNKV
jgi:two-component system response regulator